MPLLLRIVSLTRPLSMIQVSPLSVSVTGSLTVTLATFGNVEEAGCAAPAGLAAAASRLRFGGWLHFGGRLRHDSVC